MFTVYWINTQDTVGYEEFWDAFGGKQVWIYSFETWQEANKCFNTLSSALSKGPWIPVEVKTISATEKYRVDKVVLETPDGKVFQMPLLDESQRITLDLRFGEPSFSSNTTLALEMAISVILQDPKAREAFNGYAGSWMLRHLESLVEKPKEVQS